MKNLLQQSLVCLSLITMAATANAQTSKSLVLSLPIQSKSQGQIKDSSGYHNNGRVTSVIVSNSPSLVSMQQTRQFSFSAWIKPNSIPSEFPVILSKGGNELPNAYGGYEMILNVNGDHDLGFISGPVSIWTSGNLINNHTGEWIHVAFTVDDQNKIAAFYINGTIATDGMVWNGSQNSINFDAANDLYIGVPDPASNRNRRNFDGSIRDVKIWNRALTADEINQIFTGSNIDALRSMSRNTSSSRI